MLIFSLPLFRPFKPYRSTGSVVCSQFATSLSHLITTYLYIALDAKFFNGQPSLK